MDTKPEKKPEDQEAKPEEFPPIFSAAVKMQEIDVKKINFQYLSQLLDYKREEFFIKELSRYLTSNESNANLILAEVSPRGSLLHIAIRNQLYNAVEALVQQGADINSTTKNRQSAALLSCEVGDWNILDYLLRQPQVQLEMDGKPMAFLCVVVRHIENPTSLTTDYLRCFYMLVNDIRVSVNASDEYGNTALHYAIRSHNEVVLYELLNRGAYLAALNYRGESPLALVDAEVLAKYMDACIAEEKRPNGETSIAFNYKNFLPPMDVIIPAHEMTAINRMTENRNLRDLVAHPLIAMFLSVKWSGFSLFFNMNLLIYSLFCITLLMYSTLCYIYDDSHSYSLVLWFTVFTSYSYVCLITFVNLLLVPQATVRLFRFYVEFLLIGLAFMVLFVHSEPMTTRRIVTISAVISAGVELLLLIYTIQSQFVTSSLTHVKTFLMSLIHSFVLYCILIVVFSLSFWTNQVHGGDKIMMVNGTQPVVLTHLSPIAGIMKNAIHLMGQFDTSKVDLYAYAISYFIIFLFLVFVVIIIFNVFNKFMFPYAVYEAFGSVPNNLLIKAYHLNKTEELLSKFRCTYNMATCLPRTLSLPYFFMAKMVRMFSYDSVAVLIVHPLSMATYQVVIPSRGTATTAGTMGISTVAGGEESGAPPPDHMNKSIQLDRMTYQEARRMLEMRRGERAHAITQQEQAKILQRLEFKLDDLLKKTVLIEN